MCLRAHRKKQQGTWHRQARQKRLLSMVLTIEDSAPAGQRQSPSSERCQELHIVAAERMRATVKCHEPHAMAASEGEEVRIAHLAMTHQRRHVIVRHRYVVDEEAVAADSPEQGQHAASVFDADRARQDGRIGRNADEAALSRRAGGPAVGPVCRKPGSSCSVMDM